jgi:hypothetical protein
MGSFAVHRMTQLEQQVDRLTRDLQAARAEATEVTRLRSYNEGLAKNVTELEAEVERLRAALAAAKISHFHCEMDQWYSCPKSPEGCQNPSDGDDCTCGADEHNAAIDAALGERAVEQSAAKEG